MKARIVLSLVGLVSLLRGDAGVLIPSTAKQPDPAVLSLDEMAIDITIDNNHARVLVRQIFANHTVRNLEGNYVFALPSRAIVSDFAVWDDVTRIPGVILERKRAEEIYNDIRAQAIDPGLLQMGERDADEARRAAVFSARIAPIPAYGTKRIEMEYQERIPIEQLEGYFAIPLRPDAYRAQSAGHLWITLRMASSHPIKSFDAIGKAYALKVTERKPNLVQASFEGRNVPLSEDFAIKYAMDPGRGDALEVITHREEGEPGFFEASAVITAPPPAAGAPRTVVLLFDNSLSMQWEKLERSYQALETILRKLRPQDQFNVLMFNSSVQPYAPAPVAATPDAIEKALALVKASRLRGATNLQAALEAGLGQNGPDPYLVLLGDANATDGILQTGKLAEWYAAKWKQKPDAQRPHTYVFAVGDDANLTLGKILARNRGVLEWVRSTEPIDFKLNAFIGKIGRQPLDHLEFTAAAAQNFSLVYALDEAAFPGASPAWVGQYKPGARGNFSLKGQKEGKPFEVKASTALPVENPDHPQLPRTWAKARVDALLEKIERDGEDQASIDEIIKLSRKYKFVTPYTSFLAAPRALLRPRLIRPGDPILRVKTDPSIVSVVAMFPFGLVKTLRFLPEEETWQTRFLAPPDMTDGTYPVRLVLRDQQGHVYRESKTFVISSKPPMVRVKLDKTRFRPGDAVKLRVSASETTRTVTARLYGAAPVRLRWNPDMSSNTGDLIVPAHFTPGRYTLTVTAEDFAHNIGSQEVAIEVLP